MPNYGSLIWMHILRPSRTLQVRAEDLADMNVGLLVRSRVNSWNNVLISMQERTKSFAAEEIPQLDPLEPFPSLVISANSIISKARPLNHVSSGAYLINQDTGGKGCCGIGYALQQDETFDGCHNSLGRALEGFFSYWEALRVLIICLCIRLLLLSSCMITTSIAMNLLNSLSNLLRIRHFLVLSSSSLA